MPQPERDHRGRFVAGNQIASAGGQARAAKLTPRRRRAIARKARRAMVRKHFAGDDRAQRKYLAALGVWNSEKVFIGTPIPVRAQHPGPIQEWRSRYYQLDLLNGLHRDVEF
jgi:hypothetical protein